MNGKRLHVSSYIDARRVGLRLQFAAVCRLPLLATWQLLLVQTCSQGPPLLPSMTWQAHRPQLTFTITPRKSFPTRTKTRASHTHIPYNFDRRRALLP